jgi:hypothetical protein
MSDLLSGIGSAVRKYLDSPYIGHATVLGTETSTSVADYKGAPYVGFKVKLDNGISMTVKMWTPKADDSPEKASGKLLRIKEFLIACGVDPVNTPQDQLLTAVVGKRYNGVYKKRAYIGKEKTGRPAVRSSVDLWIYKKEGEPFSSFTPDQLEEGLNPDDWARLNAQQANWDRTNNPMGSAPAAGATPALQGQPQLPLGPSPAGGVEIDDDLPF